MRFYGEQAISQLDGETKAVASAYPELWARTVARCIYERDVESKLTVEEFRGCPLPPFDEAELLAA